MHIQLKEELLKFTGATSISSVTVMQTLWSGFGAIERVFLKGGRYSSVIVKRIQLPTKMEHPKGWNTSVSQQRKIRSYEIELNWYAHFASHLSASVRIPSYLFQLKKDAVTYLVLEDLNASGFGQTFDGSEKHFTACIDWLARFHAANMGENTTDLWKVGTYWHLETRQEEWQEMSNGELKKNASVIDKRLSTCQYQTLVHGDAKPANFCFDNNGEVAAVDFQYVGGGCGMKDLIYLMSSALDEADLFAEDEEILAHYFSEFELALIEVGKRELNFRELKKEWLALYGYAWTDFLRFLKGWNPESERINGYAVKLAADCLNPFPLQG